MVDLERRKGGGKLSRSETVTVRLDPKLRYLAELAARRQRRTLSSYIEWSIEDSLKRAELAVGGGKTLAEEALALWDVDEADRFAKLALRHPDLLTHEEQVLWKFIREHGGMWRGSYVGIDQEWTWQIDEESLDFAQLREWWITFCAVADGKLSPSELPRWYTTRPDKAENFQIDDDDLPF